MSSQSESGFFRRVWRALIRVLALITAVVILAAVAAAGYFGFIELQRSFSVVDQRIDASEQRVALLRSDINNLMETEQTQEVASLQATIDALQRQLSQFEETLNADLQRQEEMLTVLTEDFATMAEGDATTTEDVVALSEALTALQSDINANGMQIDALGGDVDALRTSVQMAETTLDAQGAALAEAEETTPLARTLALFRVWELISRARLRLIENNVGLAAADIEAAINTVDALLQTTPEADIETLEMVQARLALAFVSLPDSPAMAATDLETAWDELDAIFVAELGLAETAAAAAETEATAVAGDEDGIEEVTSTPVPTATPTPSP